MQNQGGFGAKSGSARRRWFVAAAALTAGAAGAESDRVTLGAFSAGDISGWENAAFDDIPESEYALAEVDGRRVLRGTCSDSASVFGIEREIDLTRTPVLHWSWRVPAVYSGLDERNRAGDDFPARVYAVIDGGWLAWRTRAINYVWASRVPIGAVWPNPFKEQAMMVAVQSGGADGWVREARNVRADFKAQFGIDANHIDGVAVMVDCDNHGGRGEAYFGDIYFTPAG